MKVPPHDAMFDRSGILFQFKQSKQATTQRCLFCAWWKPSWSWSVLAMSVGSLSGMDGAASSAATAIPSRSLPVRNRVRPCSGALAVVQRASEFSHIALCCCLGSWKNPMRITCVWVVIWEGNSLTCLNIIVQGSCSSGNSVWIWINLQAELDLEAAHFE